MHVGPQIACIFVLSMVCAQCTSLRNEPCSTINSHSGRCVPLEECPEMHALANSNGTMYSKDYQKLLAHLKCCDSSIETANKDSLVCCASPEIPLPTPTPTTTVKPDVLPSSCGGLPTVTYHVGIMGGVEDRGLVHRWSVFLDLGSKGSDRCVGSVITDRHVLTAAHCLDNKLKDDITMYFGIYDLRKKDKCLQEDTCLQRKPSEFIIHDEYNSNGKNNDIAIIRFDQPLNTTARAIEPICLPHNITYDEQTLSTTRTDDGTGVSLLSFGWGDIGGDVLSHTRRAVRLKVIAGSECENSVNSKTMCTLGVTAGHDVCNGDSGAPLVWLYDKKLYVVGVVTSGHKCGMHYNRTSTAMNISHYKDWVLAKIGS